MDKVKIVSFDPALRNLGIAKMEYDPSDKSLTLHDLELVQTEAADKSEKLRKSTDDLARAKVLHEAMKEACQDADIAVSEVPTGAQSARASFAFGIVLGLLAAVGIPLIQVSPREVKQASVGISTATKDEMIDWATTKYPLANWRRYKGKLKADNEHLADAVAVATAGVETKQFEEVLDTMRRS